MADYIYLGDSITSTEYKGKECNAVHNEGKCIRGRLGTMLVSFAGKQVNVIGRRLRKIKADKTGKL
jgi:hypothetical protein